MRPDDGIQQTGNHIHFQLSQVAVYPNHSLGGVYVPAGKGKPGAQASSLDFAVIRKRPGSLVNTRQYQRDIDLRLIEQGTWRLLVPVALRAPAEPVAAAEPAPEPLSAPAGVLLHLRRLWWSWHRLSAPQWSPAVVAVLLFLNIISLTMNPGPSGPMREEAMASEAELAVLPEADPDPARISAIDNWISDAQDQLDMSLNEFALRKRSLELGSTFNTFSRYPVDPGEREQSVQGLPSTLAIYEKYRPPAGWLDTVEVNANSEIYSDTSENWLDADGRVMKIDHGFVIMKIPRRMAPMYEYVERSFGISRYVLMAVATIESKQGNSMVSPTDCQGWGNFCPGTVRLFEGKDLLPEGFSPYDDFDGIAGIAVHLRVSSIGLTAYRQLCEQIASDPAAGWPVFWDGETPALSAFENHSWKSPIIPATWGYNRNSYYGWSVAQLAKFYQDHDVL